jgi:hypothetical protein
VLVAVVVGRAVLVLVEVRVAATVSVAAFVVVGGAGGVEWVERVCAA